MWNAIIALLQRTGISLTIPFSATGYTKPMKDLITLIDAICDTYDRADLLPHDGVTYCNVGVSAVATAMGCKDFAAKTADEIIEFMEKSPDWSEVPFDKSQDMANEGSLLIAGLKSTQLSQAHGHVCVIRPGKPCYSGKWGLTPRCLNIGAENFLARGKRGVLTNAPAGLNQAFESLPKIHIWRPSL